MTKVEAITALLKEKGGAASWSYIYDNIERFYPNAKSSANWKAGIRAVVLRELYQDRYFKRIDVGIYALREYDDIETLEGTKEAVTDKKTNSEGGKSFRNRCALPQDS